MSTHACEKNRDKQNILPPKSIPYSVLMQNERAYTIMLLRDQQNMPFSAIAAQYGLSITRAMEIYHRIKVKQIRLYMDHIAASLGPEGAGQVKKDYYDAIDCYQDQTYVAAFLEEKYADILTAYRAGEPGMPPSFTDALPPFKPQLSKKTIARIIDMRDAEKATFAEIAQKLHLTPEKARHTYESFYSRQVVKLVNAMQDKAETPEEKTAIWNQYLGNTKSRKNIYDRLAKG